MAPVRGSARRASRFQQPVPVQARLPTLVCMFHRHPMRRCADPRAQVPASIDGRRIRSVDRFQEDDVWRVRLQAVVRRVRETQLVVPAPTSPADGCVRAERAANHQMPGNREEKTHSKKVHARVSPPESGGQRIRRNPAVARDERECGRLRSGFERGLHPTRTC